MLRAGITILGRFFRILEQERARDRRSAFGGILPPPPCNDFLRHSHHHTNHENTGEEFDEKRQEYFHNPAHDEVEKLQADPRNRILWFHSPSPVTSRPLIAILVIAALHGFAVEREKPFPILSLHKSSPILSYRYRRKTVESCNLASYFPVVFYPKVKSPVYYILHMWRKPDIVDTNNTKHKFTTRKGETTLPCSWNNDTRLLDTYDCLGQLYRHYVDENDTMEPLDWLMFAILSQRTQHKDAVRSFNGLLRVFPSWDAVRKSPVHRLEHTIDSSTWSDKKALQLKESLDAVHYWRRGQLSLDHLYAMSDWDAGIWMERLPGVGRKTAYCVLLFSRLRRAVLPVDTGFRRFAERYEVLSRSASAKDAHAILRKQLPEDWDALQLELFHGTIKWFAQNYCKHEPACAMCPLLERCRFGQRQLDSSNHPEIKRRQTRSSFQESFWQLCLDFA